MSVCVCVCERERDREREHKASNRRCLHLCKIYCISFNDTELSREETLLMDINHGFLYRKCSAIEFFKVTILMESNPQKSQTNIL